MEAKVAKLGEAAKDITVEGESSTVQAMLTEANIEVKEGDTLMVDGLEATPETEVKDGGIVTIVPKVKGG